MACGALPTRRRVARPRNLDIPPHHRRLLPRGAIADPTRTHAPAPPRSAPALPVLPLRRRPRRAHAAAATGRAFARGARGVALYDA
jgi:hypothetical protein